MRHLDRWAMNSDNILVRDNGGRWCLYEEAAILVDEKITSTNSQSKTVTIGCTCGERMSTVHLCDECFRDAVTA